MSQQLSVELSNSIEQFREYLRTEEGQHHINYLREKEPKETREILEKLRSLPKESSEFVELVLYGLLPNGKTGQAKRVSISPAFLNIKKFFERFNYSEEDWRQLSRLVFELVSKFEQNPGQLDDYIREFISHRLSKALQCGSISPILFALNHKFPIVNNRQRRAYRTLSFLVLGQADELGQRLEDYLADVAKIQTLIKTLAKIYHFTEVEDYAVFDLFCYWYDEYSKPTEVSGHHRGKPTPLVGPNIADEQIANFIQAMPNSQPTAYFIGTGDPFNLQKFNDEGRIIYNTEFQRGEVWDKLRKQKLIDSILRGYSINTVFFRNTPEGKFECLDGQQRLKTIREFMNGEFAISPKVTPEFKHETKFSDLPPSLKNKFISYPIYAITFYTNKDSETCKIFLRLQEGLPLNSPEKLNAIMGSLHDLIVELANHKFVKSLGVEDYRFAHRYIVAQVLLLTLRNQLTDSKYRHLDEMYTTYKETKLSDSVIYTVNRALNLLEREFGENAKVIKYNADFVTLYWLAKHLMENYAVSNTDLGLKDFFVQFASRVGQVETSEGDNAAYYDYKTYRKTSADSKNSMEKRFNVILAKFLSSKQSLQPKDPNRNYDYWEKLAIYARDEETCQICGKAAPFDKGTVDHKIPHSKGGPTTIENGQWAHIQCNLEKLAKSPQ